MMHVSVQFQGERLEFEVDDARVVACWEGPTGMATTVASAAARGILEQPWDFPPFRQMIVPGDRVTIALDATIVRPQTILEVLVQMLREAGVEAEEVTILATSGSHRFENVAGPDIKVVVHDATDRTELAYLAATNQGRRIYLNRHLTDADAVIPVGRLGYDPIMGYRGPWSVVFPELSEMAAIDTHRGRFHDEADDLTGARSKANLDESFEAGWLLGSQFQVGIVPGTSGWAEIVAGRENVVRERGIATLNAAWTLNAEARAELVVVGIGGPDSPASFDDLAAGLATASRLVQHGGKIVALSRVGGRLGPAVSRLVDLDDHKARAAALRGHEADEDFVAARRLSQALAWADVFVLSAMASEVVESLSLVPLENSNQALRLVGQSGSCSFVSRAEFTRAEVRE